MPVQDSFYKSATPGKVEGEADTGSKKIYRVVLEGVKNEFETIESFAIKYSIVTNTPVTRIKFLLRNMPVTILESQSAVKARSALSLIEEAGGAGLIEEFDPVKPPKIEISEKEPTNSGSNDNTCPKCGFPLKKEDEFCQFCNTPLVEKKMHKFKEVMQAGGGGNIISPKRLIVYVSIILLIMLLDLLLK